MSLEHPGPAPIGGANSRRPVAGTKGLRTAARLHPHRAAAALGSLVHGRGLQKRLADRELTLEVSDKAKQWLAEPGYEPEFGARPLERLLQQQILEPLSKAILAGDFGSGDTVYVNLAPAGEVLVVEAEAAPLRVAL